MIKEPLPLIKNQSGVDPSQAVVMGHSVPSVTEEEPSIPEAFLEQTLAHQKTQIQNHFPEMIGATPDYVMIADIEGNMLYCNSAARTALEIGETEDLSSIHLDDLYPTSVSAHILGEGVLAAILDGVWSGETVLLSRSGKEIPVSQVIVVPLAADGRCQYLSITARDVTESKQAEAALRKNVTFYRRIIETAGIGIWIIDADNKTSYVNGKIADLLGYSIDEMTGQSILAFLDAEGIAMAHAQAGAPCADRRESHELKLRRKDGVAVWVHLSTSPLFDEQEQYTGTLATVTDISKEKQAQDRLLQWSGLR